MAESASIGLNDLKGMFLRRLWIVVLCCGLLTPLAVGIAYVLPPVYSATARILVETQQIPNALARSTVTADASERLELIRQRLLTRQNLIEIIDQYKLYEQYTAMPLADKIENLRRATVFENIAFGGGGVSAFTIAVSTPSPVLAASVTNEFVTRALDLNLKQRTARATETVEFFKQEVANLSRALADIENRILEMKVENPLSLPETMGFRASEVQSLEKKLFDNKSRRLQLENQKQEIVMVLSQGLQVPAAQLSPLQQQLQTLQSELAQQKLVLSPSHPTIRALEGRIASIESALTAESGDESEEKVDPTAYQRGRLERQINIIEVELSRLSEVMAKDEERLDELREALDRAPEVEMELSGLIRRKAEMQQQYASAAAKLSDAETGEKLEVNRQAERLVVIEQAQVPTSAKSPNCIMIAVGGAIGSLVLGIGIAVLLELINSSIRSTRDMQRKVGLMPIVVIPYIRTKREIRVGRIRLAAAALVIVICIPTALYVIDQHYLPLSVLADKIGKKTGLDVLMETINQNSRLRPDEDMNNGRET